MRRDVHVHKGPFELVQDEPVAFRVLYDGRTVVPVYAVGRRIYETWRDENGEKFGRWAWRYV
jgi:hypothetical protein